MTSRPVPGQRLQRILGTMSLGIVLLCVLAIIAILLGPTVFGVTDQREGLWPTIFTLPLVGLPLAFLLFLGVIITGAVARSRSARD